MSSDRDELVHLAHSIPDDVVPIALEFVRDLHVGAEARARAELQPQPPAFSGGAPGPADASAPERHPDS